MTKELASQHRHKLTPQRNVDVSSFKHLSDYVHRDVEVCEFDTPHDLGG